MPIITTTIYLFFCMKAIHIISFHTINHHYYHFLHLIDEYLDQKVALTVVAAGAHEATADIY